MSLHVHVLKVQLKESTAVCSSVAHPRCELPLTEFAMDHRFCLCLAFFLDTEACDVDELAWGVPRMLTAEGAAWEGPCSLNAVGPDELAWGVPGMLTVDRAA